MRSKSTWITFLICVNLVLVTSIIFTATTPPAAHAQGTGLAGNYLVVAGEIPFALTTYHYEPETLKKSGAPIDWYAIGKVVVRPNGSGVARRAPHPHAALLFYDFMLSEGQKLLATRNIEVMSKEVPNAIGDLPRQSIDSAEILDDFAKWERLYNEIFVNQSL